ncbi:MAG: transporter [Cyanobacteria bacterium HKST-UBA06]|nr:transporter [Cyanobacteria bacterium HKST-UBA06]
MYSLSRFWQRLAVTMACGCCGCCLTLPTSAMDDLSPSSPLSQGDPVQDQPVAQALGTPLGEVTMNPGPVQIGNVSMPYDHAPIGVMGDHTHKQGEWMLSYRYGWMHMDGNRNGSSALSDAQVLGQFPVAPTEMNMQMHMFGAMVAPTDRVTLMAMVPFVKKAMAHRTRGGQVFTTQSQGMGDLTATGLIRLLDRPNGRVAHHIHLNTGVSIPIGSIEQRDDTPTARNANLPYPMQIGSGTWDLLPGVTYTGKTDHWNWGTQATSTVRLGHNKRDYRLGNRLAVTPWLARRFGRYISTSVRLNGQIWGDIEGADGGLNPRMIQTANPALQSGERLDLLFGVNVMAPRKGILKGQRLAFEFGLPVYQRLAGPQLETDFMLMGGWQWLLPF